MLYKANDTIMFFDERAKRYCEATIDHFVPWMMPTHMYITYSPYPWEKDGTLIPINDWRLSEDLV